MSACSMTTNSQITGENVTHTVSMTPLMPLFSGAFLRITLPLWFSPVITQSNIGAPTPLSCTGVSVYCLYYIEY